MFTLNQGKEAAQTRRPIILCDFTFPDGSVLYAATLAVTYGGHDYLPLIESQDIAQLASLSEQGIDRVPSATIRIADPGATVWSAWERGAGKGFKGATLKLQLVLLDVETGEFSTDALVPFLGLCDQPALDEKYLTVTAASRLNLSKYALPTVPIQRRCPWINPATAAERVLAADASSRFYLCGETRDLATAPPCQYNKQTCTQPARYGGSCFGVESSGSGRQYINKGGRISWKNPDTSGKYNQFWPLWLGGKAWVEAIVLNQWADGNYTRGEAAVGVGAIQIEKVICNGVQLDYSPGMTGDYRYHKVNDGSRNGAHNADVGYENGDTYGNCTVIQFLAPHSVIDPNSEAQIRVLGKRLNLPYADPQPASLGGESPGWVLAEALRWSRFTDADLNLDTFATAASICDPSITYTDKDGATGYQPRFSTAIALKERRSAAEIVRGIRQSVGGLLVPGTDGRLQFKLEGPLAEQQSSAVDGSNDDTPIASKLRTGAAANGYLAYRFNESNSRGLKRIARPASESPNRVSFPIVDPSVDFATSQFSLVDPDDAARMDQESPGGLQVQPEGIASQNHAYRIARLGLAKIHRGNPAGDTRGTDWWEWQTSFRGCRLLIGQLVAIDNARYGLSSQLVRLTEIKPSRNYEEVTLRGHAHSDDWYLDAPGSNADPSAGTHAYDPADATTLGDVQPISGQPFTLTKTEDGINAVLEGEYDPPAIMGGFCGVVAQVEDPDTSKVIALSNPYDYDGDPAAAAGTAARRGHFKVVYPQPVAAGSTIRVYLASRSQGYSKPLVFHGDTGETPSVTVSLSQATPPLAAPDPIGPTAVSLSVLESGDNFGLRTGWTPAAPYGGTCGYEREVRYYSDNTASTPISDWIPLGALYGATTATADSGYWPKPTTATYVRLRVRAYNADGDVTSWVQSATPLPSVPQSAGYSVPAPSNPTSPTLTVIDQDGNFGLRTAWTAPVSLGSTVGYDREVRYYSDSGAVTAISDWIPLGPVGSDVVTADSGFWPRPGETQYVRFRVRAFNANDAKGAWVYSATPLPTVDPLAAPPTPASNDSIIQTASMAGVESFRFHLVTSSGGGSTDGFIAQARYYSDAGATTPTSEWIPLGWIDPAVTTLDTDYWPRPKTQDYAKVRVAAQNSDNVLSAWRESAILTRPAGKLDPGSIDPTQSVPGDYSFAVAPSASVRADGMVEVTFTPGNPAPATSVGGFMVQVELPDQSATPPTISDGSVLSDGSRLSGGLPEPATFGPYQYSASQGPISIAVRDPGVVCSGRVRVAAISQAGIQKAWGTAPSATFSYTPPSGPAKPAAANAYCEMATWGATPIVVGSPYDQNGILDEDLVVSGITPPADPTCSGWEIWSSEWPGDSNAYLELDLKAATSGNWTIACPASVFQIRLWLRSYSKDAAGKIHRNPLVPGLTPSVLVEVGTTGGTVNLSAVIPSTATALRIDQFAGNLAIARLSNLASFNIAGFSGNLTIDRLSNLGTFNIADFTGNLGIERLTNLGSFNITNFTGNLPVSRVDNIGTINISDLTGSLNFDRVANLGSFNIGNFSGVIVSSQLAQGFLDDLAKFATDLRPITRVNGLPALPSAAYPVGTIVLNIADSKLYKNTADVWGAVTASDTVTGKVADTDILALNANKLTGQVNAGVITHVQVSEFAGTLSAAQAGSVSISSFAGSLDVSRVANLGIVSISSFAGSLDASRVANLNLISISSFTGTLDASRVANLGSINIQTFTGTLNVGSQLDDLSISSAKLQNIVGKTLTLNLNNVEARIGNDGFDGEYAGLTVTRTANSQRSAVFAGLIKLYNTVGTTLVLLSSGGANGGSLALYNASTGFAVATLGAGPSGGELYATGRVQGKWFNANGMDVIDSTGTFTGAGVNCPLYGVAAAGFNPNVGGVQYYGRSGTFYDRDGAALTFRNGILTTA